MTLAADARDRLAETLAAFEAQASPKVRADMAPRYGIVTDKAIGVPMAKMQAVAKRARPRPRPRRRALGDRRLRGAHGRLA